MIIKKETRGRTKNKIFITINQKEHRNMKITRKNAKQEKI